MVSRKKVVKGLQCCNYRNYMHYTCFQCPYKDINRAEGMVGCTSKLSEDALELIDEQKEGHWTTKRTQEHDGELYCDRCGYEPQVFENTPFCPNCGIRMEQHVWNKAVKWNAD